MKIGFSLSRCVVDLLADRVKFEDVFIIFTGTHFDPRVSAEWSGLWQWYHYGGVWDTLEEDQTKEMVLRLFNQRRLFQPRIFHKEGLSDHIPILPTVTRQTWMELILCPEDMENHPMLKAQWEKFLMLNSLVNNEIN